MFSEKEVAYLKSQKLGRIATASPAGQPDVAPVTYGFDGENFTVLGFDLPSTLKYRNVKAGQARVAFVVDDLESVSPWVARGLKVHGLCEILETGGRPVMKIRPTHHWSWGIEAAGFVGGQPARRSIRHGS
jgi:pyridoxamine 5'-phosphate oxidase family protein